MLRDRVARASSTLAGGLVLLVALAVAVVAPPREPERVVRGHEPGDANVRGVIAVACLLLAGLAVAVVVVSWLEVRFTGYGVSLTPPAAGVANAPDTAAALPRQEPSPAKQALPLSGTPTRALAELREGEARTLSTYGWIDRDAGIVRIPIDRAIDVLARRGLPSAPAAPPRPVVDPSASGRFVERRSP